MARSALAGQTVKLAAGVRDPRNMVVAGADYRVEDYWTEVSSGVGWKQASENGNPAALNYEIRRAATGLPLDDEVLYGKIGGLGHLVHVSEVVAN